MKSFADSGRIRVGLLGCSDIARRRFIPALLKSSTGVLAALSGRSRAKAAQFIPGAEYTVLENDELISSPDIDLVYVSLPNHLHEEWTIRALEAGKHVICEKPLGLTEASVARMLHCAGSKGLLLFENLMFLYHPQHAVVKSILASGRIGRIRTVRTVFGIPGLNSGNFRLDPESGGGSCNDMSRYPLATALCFLRDDRFRFSGFALERNELNCAVNGTAVNAAGELFTFSMAFGQQYECFYEIVGETGKITVDRAFTPPPDLVNSIRISTPDGETVQEVPAADHFLLALDHACSLLQAGGGFHEIHERSRTIAALAEQLRKGCTNVAV